MTRSLCRYRLIVFLAAVCIASAFLPAVSKAEGVTVNTPEEFTQAIKNHVETITLGTDITTSELITIDYALTIVNDDFHWIHNGIILFKSREFNYDDIRENVKEGQGFLVRYRDSVSLTGTASDETVIEIQYADGTKESGGAASATIDSGRLMADFLGKKAASWRDMLEVTGIVTDRGEYRLGSKNPVLSREYSITYLTTITGEKNILENDLWPSNYTEDDEGVALPADIRLSGYKFLGWSADDGATDYVTEIPAGSTGDKEFYAIMVEDSQQGSGIPGGWSGHSISGFSGLIASSEAGTSEASASDAASQVQAAAEQPGMSNSGRKTATGKARTEVVFSDNSSGSLDLDGVIDSTPKQDHTKQVLILGIGLVVAAAIGIVTVLKKKR